VAVRGLISRDEGALILGFEYAKRLLKKKKFRAYVKEPGRSHELRIPLHEIAGLSPGWGWGRPPRSLLLRVTRLSALAGLPETQYGEVQLFIPRADRPEARRLIESIAPATFETGAPNATGALFDHARARWEIRVPAIGLLVSGVLTLLFWTAVDALQGANLAGLVLGRVRTESTEKIGVAFLGNFTEVDEHAGGILSIWLVAAVASVPIIAVSGVLIVGAVKMLRLNWYPLAATATIVAMIPWSPVWVVSLPFGIWACNVLGRPAVAEAFFSAERGVGLAHANTPRPRGFVASRFLSLVHSMVGYMVTLPGQKSVAADPQDEQSSTQSRVPTPTVDYTGEPRER
jgi:hypothetical protein